MSARIPANLGEGGNASRRADSWFEGVKSFFDDMKIMTTRIGITGAAGRMGRTLIEAYSASADDLQLGCGYRAPRSSLLGADAGELGRSGQNGVVWSAITAECDSMILMC